MVRACLLIKMRIMKLIGRAKAIGISRLNQISKLRNLRISIRCRNTVTVKMRVSRIKKTNS
mgnify:CR=1 FL=1